MARFPISLLLFLFFVSFYLEIRFAEIFFTEAVHSLERNANIHQKSPKLQVPKSIVSRLSNDDINKIVNSLCHAVKSFKNPEQRIQEILNTQIAQKHVTRLDADDRKKIIEDVLSKLNNLSGSAQSKLDSRMEKINPAQKSQTEAEKHEEDNKATIAKLEAEKQCLMEKLESMNNLNKLADNPQSGTNLLLSRGYETIPLMCPIFSLKELTPRMPEFILITTYVTNSNYDFATSQNRNGAYKVNIIKIYSIHYNKERKVHFKNKTDSKLNRYLLFHGTKVDNVNPILRDGFVLDPNRVANGAKHGTGIYFADRACFAGGYSYHSNYGANSVIFLSEVALGKQFVDNGDVIVPGAENHAHLTLENLPENADSIFGPGKYIPANNELFEDSIVVPSGKTIVSDTSKVNNYNEFYVLQQN